MLRTILTVAFVVVCVCVFGSFSHSGGSVFDSMYFCSGLFLWGRHWDLVNLHFVLEIHVSERACTIYVGIMHLTTMLNEVIFICKTNEMSEPMIIPLFQK